MKSAAGFLLGLGANIHRRVGRRLRNRRGQPSCAVMCVGGLTLGGAGKTPVAARLAWGLSRRGHRVVLASRGYKGHAREAVTVVSDGSLVRSPVVRAGDEALLLAAQAPGVPVLVGRDRRRVGLAAVARFGCEILILDDGFQHHRLARDVDFVCIDAEFGLGNGKVFPAGPLREPLSALRDADWLCLVRSGPWPTAEPTIEEQRLLAALRQDGVAPGRWASGRRRVTGLRSPGDDRRASAESLHGRSVGLLSGVGQPSSVRRSVESLGARVVAERRFPDHHPYRPQDLKGLADDASEWLTTEKDALKILPAWAGDAILRVLEMRIEFENEAELLDRLEADLAGARHRHSGGA